MAFDLFGKNSNMPKTYRVNNQTVFSMNAQDANKILAANTLFPRKNIEWYTKFNRYGCTDPLNNITANREFLFFTKPDLNIFKVNDGGSSPKYEELQLTDELSKIPLFIDAYDRYKNVLCQLQGSVVDSTNNYNPFMCLLSNAVTSKLDMPGISAEVNESSTNMYGSSIQYRSHSRKSDNGYDFTLSFTDTVYTEIYMLAKLYDEYHKLEKAGLIAPRTDYLVNRIIPNQFAIYKFVVKDDAESIIFAAKFTGVFITDVPRSDFSDPAQDGFKYSLSFHSQFVEDTNPMIFSDFNRSANVPIVNGTFNFNTTVMPVYNSELNVINNEWAGLPMIVKTGVGDARVAALASNGLGRYNYMLKWRRPQ